MFNISNNKIISLERGDSGKFKVTINLGSSISPELYELKDNDKVYFGVMEPNEMFENSLIRKVYTKKDLDEDGTLTIELNSKDTEYLISGTYYYEIKLEINSYEKRENNSEYLVSNVYTIQPRRHFFILE